MSDLGLLLTARSDSLFTMSSHSGRMKAGMSDCHSHGYLRRKSAQNKADLGVSNMTSLILLCEIPDPTVPLWPYTKEFPVFLKLALFVECFSAIPISYNPQNRGQQVYHRMALPRQLEFQ